MEILWYVGIVITVGALAILAILLLFSGANGGYFGSQQDSGPLWVIVILVLIWGYFLLSSKPLPEGYIADPANSKPTQIIIRG